LSVFTGDYFELLCLGPVLAYELSKCTLNLSHFIFYTSVGFSETPREQPCWFPVALSSSSLAVSAPADALSLAVGPGGICHKFYST